MLIRLHPLELTPEYEFTIAHGTTVVQSSLVVELSQDGERGYGESTANAYYGFTVETMSRSVERCRALIESYTFGTPQELWERLQPLLQDDPFALSAIDMAAHDLYGKLRGARTFELLGLQWEGVPVSSYTIGIDTLPKMVEKLKHRPGWQIYKIKLGTPHDVEIVSELRKHTDALFRVDANCGWGVDEAIANSHQLRQLGVEFIEQPLRADIEPAESRRLYQESALPIVADESCLVESDVARCAGHFHGVNVKLCKCGGITPAIRMLKQARTLGMKTMVGCMVESSVGISGAAQLLPLLDYTDLDGAELLAVDPARGVAIDHGVARLGTLNGTGAELI